MAIHARTLQCVLVTALVGGLVCAPAHAVSVGLTDTFAGVSTAGWSTGGASPVPPAAQAGGGPAGAADPYLLLSAIGHAGAGGRLVAFSGAQWAGDYLQAGVSAISLDANNLLDQDYHDYHSTPQQPRDVRRYDRTVGLSMRWKL